MYNFYINSCNYIYIYNQRKIIYMLKLIYKTIFVNNLYINFWNVIINW